MPCEENDDVLFRSSPLKLLIWSIDETPYMWLCIVEYSIVSLSLSLVIAKFFPAIHNQIVSRVTRVEHQSLYWGTVIVSNIFTYGLLFFIGKGWSVVYFLPYILAIVVILEVVCVTILFVGALVASCRGHGGTGVPIPKGMPRIMIYVSSCFFCSVGCSARCKTKVLRVLVLFSFMSFIYHSILDIISVTIFLFIEESRASTVTFTLLYISLLVFLVLFVSFSLLSLIQHNVSGWDQYLNCFGGAFIFIAVFGALMLLVAIYMIIVFSLHLQGVGGIVTGLIPSIVLSSISWYIKKTIFQEQNTSSSSSDMSQLPTEYGTIINENEKLEDESRKILP